MTMSIDSYLESGIDCFELEVQERFCFRTDFDL
jgi:hypothetical protein